MADTGSDAYKQLDEDAMGYTAREMEAKMIAGEIRRLTDETDGLLVWDKEQEKYRRACLGRYGDPSSEHDRLVRDFSQRADE